MSERGIRALLRSQRIGKSERFLLLRKPTDNDSYACHPLRYSWQGGIVGWKKGAAASYASSSRRRKRPLPTHATDTLDRRDPARGEEEEYRGISMRKGCLEALLDGAGEPKGWTIQARVMDRLPIPSDRIDETLIRVEWPDPTGKYRAVRGAHRPDKPPPLLKALLLCLGEWASRSPPRSTSGWNATPAPHCAFLLRNWRMVPTSFANCTLRSALDHRWDARGRRMMIDCRRDSRYFDLEISKMEDTHARYVVVVANTLLQKSVANLPSENRWTLPFIVGDFVHYRRGRHTWLATANCTRFNWTGLVVPGKNKPISSLAERSKQLHQLEQAIYNGE